MPKPKIKQVKAAFGLGDGAHSGSGNGLPVHLSPTGIMVRHTYR
jgi:hypothetical protein